MTAQEILKLIEAVSPDDTAKLDEIDEEVYFYVEQPKNEHQMRQGIVWQPFPKKYTRSRDALKAIRPKGSVIQIRPCENLNGFKFVADIFYPYTLRKGMQTTNISLPTEELAELHAIIQAIEYERGNK